MIATVISLSNATYGAPGGLGWCWVVPTASTPKWALKLWFWLSYYIWLWLTFAVIVVYFGLIALKLALVRAETAAQFRVIFYKMLGYPIIIFVSWFPSTCSDFALYTRFALILHPGQLVDTRPATSTRCSEEARQEGGVLSTDNRRNSDKLVLLEL